MLYKGASQSRWSLLGDPQTQMFQGFANCLVIITIVAYFATYILTLFHVEVHRIEFISVIMCVYVCVCVCVCV